MSRIRIRRGDRELEIEGDPAFLESQLDRLMAVAFGEGQPREPEEIPQLSATFTVRKNLSFEDFLNLKLPRTEVERLLVLAYYQEKYESRSAYAVQELSDLWAEAWPALPLDESVWKEALERGYLQWQPEGRLTLSFVGENYVRDGLA